MDNFWPDKSLGSQSLADRMSSPRKYLKQLEHWWHRDGQRLVCGEFC
jgi:hypothetical protein